MSSVLELRQPVSGGSLITYFLLKSIECPFQSKQRLGSRYKTQLLYNKTVKRGITLPCINKRGITLPCINKH